MRADWTIEQTDFSRDGDTGAMESLYTLGNGFLGIRGDFPLAGEAVEKGTFINGFYESGPITYGEKAFGFADNWQTIVPLPEGKDLRIFIDGMELFGSEGTFLERRRVLDMENSLIIWHVRWIDGKKREFRARVTETVPFEFRGIVRFHWEITLPGEGMAVRIVSSLTREVKGKTETDDPRLPGHFDGSTITSDTIKGRSNRSVLSVRAEGSRLTAFAAMANTVRGLQGVAEKKQDTMNSLVENREGASDGKLEIVKTVAYDFGSSDREEGILSRMLDELESAESVTQDLILGNQSRFMKQFWDASDVHLDGDGEVQLSLRYNLFQLLQSTGRDGRRSIAAKGLSGSGYEGHYFWDAETYVLPFFIYTNPSIARSMLSYRISTIQAAEKRAAVLNHAGILFPWRTINGDECSAYFPAGTAQYHINSDIALGLSRYLEVTGDLSLLDDGGDRLLAGTARFWADFGTMVENRGFCFHDVTGPDEYTAIVDNNYYTNLSARENLKAAAFWLDGRIDESERNGWLELADLIYLPPNGTVTPQNDNYLEKEIWDFGGTPDESYPLLLHFHPLNIYRKQVLKQADVVMAQALFPRELPEEQKRMNFDYYEQITTRDSSLSACAQGINAFRLGYKDLAWEYFEETLHTDRKDLHGNVSHGLHTAAMGGSYLMVLYGFLGLEFSEGIPVFNPDLPEKLEEIALKLRLGEGILRIVVGKKEVLYEAGKSRIIFYHGTERIDLAGGDKAVRMRINGEKRQFMHFRPRT